MHTPIVHKICVDVDYGIMPPFRLNIFPFYQEPPLGVEVRWKYLREFVINYIKSAPLFHPEYYLFRPLEFVKMEGSLMHIHFYYNL